ncbi:bacillithiol biosynthesis deacetylase BshB2 [Cohnella fermenti]|uniref:Bacillithiol biosynthesis deacetylase BshB2 n=1 Tax=Cohnella fermenti TaxID=2565925 RepID=A0A4S4BGR6_9BACL|nr:bacillithiol biosynthesis deacetylase BshB2 [Cohnella fermenti]THF73651.1 bacillithiol biosynthesis deacetylase BshB2 [Cohnella fermenti]
MHQSILVVLPHPDDECFGLSGTLAKEIAGGARVTYGCLTLGQMGRNMGAEPYNSRVALPSVRKGELEKSCAAIGIQDVRLMGFHDKTIEFEDRTLLDGAIEELVREVKPDVIYTFYPGYSVHPDHDATGAAVVRVIGRLPKGERPPVRCMAFSRDHERDIGGPDVFEDVKSFLKPKVASILAHRTQFQVPGLDGENAHKSKELQERFGTERFWTYPFGD